jgi:hypothetical protein
MKLALTCAITTFALIAVSPVRADIIEDCIDAGGEANAIAICTKAIAATTKAKDLAIAYGVRGCTYLDLGKRAQGLKDIAMARRLDSKVPDLLPSGCN